MSPTKYTTLTLDNGIEVFYRSAGKSTNPVVLLLHGFPTSSHQYRNLIPLLAEKYHVIAPDLPGFGFTLVPESLKYQHTFANLAKTVGSFLDALLIFKFAVYIFDYGAPTALRLALERPTAITAIISQNGNAYLEGLGEFWAPFQKYWKSDSAEDRRFIHDNILSFTATKWQYHNGNPNADAVAPETYYLDQALMERPGNKEIQLDLFKDYATNLPFYPKFQEYFRKSKVPVLAIWGKGDEIFIAPGAEAYKKDVEDVEVELLDAPHFAIETREEYFAKRILEFLGKRGI